MDRRVRWQRTWKENKMKTLKTIVIAGIILTSCAAFAQELTPEQLAVQQQKTALRASKPTVSRQLTPEQLEMVRQITPPPVPPRSHNFTKKIKKDQVGAAPLSRMMTIMSLDVGTTQCIEDPYVFYGVPTFLSEQWLTDTDYYLWYSFPENQTLRGTNGVGIQSCPGNLLPAHWCSSFIFVALTNHYNQYGDPSPHLLSFWYRYDSPVSSIFKCSLALVPGDNGSFHTNLPLASSWTRVTVIVPPYYYGNGMYSNLQFTVFKESTTPNLGPTAYLDPSVQWCPIPTPEPTADDLQITKLVGTNVVEVTWNALIYPTQRWSLEFAGDVMGPYSTNTGSGVTVTNNVASTTFTGTNDARFYRLKHN